MASRKKDIDKKEKNSAKINVTYCKADILSIYSRSFERKKISNIP